MKVEVIDRLLTIMNTVLHFTGSPGDKPARTEGVEGIITKAGFLGLGMKDEALFAHACHIAMRDHRVKINDLQKIVGVLNSLDIGKRKNVILMIGQGDQPVVQEEPKKGDKGEKEKGETKPIAFENKRGAEIIALLSKMSAEEMLAFLHASGTTISTGEVLREKVAMAADMLKGVGDFNEHIGKAVNFLEGAINSIPRPSATTNWTPPDARFLERIRQLFRR